MSYSYNYEDKKYIYIDEKTGLLKNLLEIKDKETLLIVESGAVTKRLKELYENPIRIKSTKSLFKIHQHLFQDVYEWAGELRLVDISKDGKQFFPINQFDTALNYIDSLISNYNLIPNSNKASIAFALAEILDHINYLHPFREGNGRVQREFLRLLALEKGFDLNLNPVDNSDVYNRYMTGTINSDLKVLENLILELLIKRNL